MGITARTYFTVTLARLLVLRSSQRIFEENRDCSQSPRMLVTRMSQQFFSHVDSLIQGTIVYLALYMIPVSPHCEFEEKRPGDERRKIKENLFVSHLHWIKEREINMFCVVCFIVRTMFFSVINFKHLIVVDGAKPAATRSRYHAQTKPHTRRLFAQKERKSSHAC